METSVREFSGRTFSSADIALIKETVSTYRNLPRSELACTICELLGWTTPNGRPKSESCMRLLKHLEAESMLRLPPIKERKQKAKVERHSSGIENTSWMDMRTLTDCEDIVLTIARPGDALRRWRAYIKTFHMIGDTYVYEL